MPLAAPTPSQSDVVTEILAPGPMILAARVVVLAVGVLILVASVYAIASIAIRMNRREWLRRAGGFEPELGQPAEHLNEILDSSWVFDEPQPTQDKRPQEGSPDDS